MITSCDSLWSIFEIQQSVPETTRHSWRQQKAELCATNAERRALPQNAGQNLAANGSRNWDCPRKKRRPMQQDAGHNLLLC